MDSIRSKVNDRVQALRVQAHNAESEQDRRQAIERLASMAWQLAEALDAVRSSMVGNLYAVEREADRS